MTRLFSVLLLASLIAGFAAAGTPAPHAERAQAVVLSETSGNHPGGPMADMECGACAAMGACIASGPSQSAGPVVSGLPPRQSPFRSSNQAWAPDTAPPKPSSL